MERIDVEKEIKEGVEDFEKHGDEYMWERKRKVIMEKAKNRGEYCGFGESGNIKALERAAQGEGIPAVLSHHNEWFLLSQEDLDDLVEVIPHEFNEGIPYKSYGGSILYNFDFNEPVFTLYYGSNRYLTDPKKGYETNLQRLKQSIESIGNMYNTAKREGEKIEDGGGMSLIDNGDEVYLLDKDGDYLVVSKDGYERVYSSLSELVAKVGAEKADEPGEDGQPGTIYWDGGWQGGMGGGVTIVIINGVEYYRQI